MRVKSCMRFPGLENVFNNIRLWTHQSADDKFTCFTSYGKRRPIKHDKSERQNVKETMLDFVSKLSAMHLKSS